MSVSLVEAPPGEPRRTEIPRIVQAVQAVATWVGWWSSLFVVAAVTAWVAWKPPYTNSPPIRSDGVGYHLWTRAILEGDLSFRKYEEQPGITMGDASRGVCQNAYPPGMALLRFPVMAFLVDLRPDGEMITPAEHVADQVYSALALVLICFFALSTCRRLGTGPLAANVAVLALVFGTGLFHYATFDSFASHVYSALATAFAIWLGVRTLAAGQSSLPWLPTALCCFFFVEFRNPNILMLALLVAAYFGWKWRLGLLDFRGTRSDLAAILGGTMAAVVLQLGYNWYATGHFALSTYRGTAFRWDQPIHDQVLWSYEHGLFTGYPVVAVALVAAWLPRRSRPAAAWFTLLLGLSVAVYGYWNCLPPGFGHRGFVDLMPAAMIALAAGLGAMRGWHRAAVAGAALVCAFVTVGFMLGYWWGSFPFDGPNREQYWAHVWGRHSLLGLWGNKALAWLTAHAN